MTSPYRVLVVEDHAPFRRAICELLQERADVRIVGEAADGLDAIRQAETLQPDVVTLDVGLPGLNGLEVARRMRAVIPDAKLMFVTVESSLEIGEQALQDGAHAYVYKPRVQRDLLTVFDAIVRGGRFVSGGLERIARGDGLATHRHDVIFCSSDDILVGAASRFIAGALSEGSPVIALMAEAHEEPLRRRLQASQVDLAEAIRQQRYMPLKIDEMLMKVMVNGRPDPVRFGDAAREVVAEAARHARGRFGKVVALGECAPTLWADGQVEAAIQLEHLWDEIGKSREMDILCLYPMVAREESVRAVRSLCAEHTHVEIS